MGRYILPFHRKRGGIGMELQNVVDYILDYGTIGVVAVVACYVCWYLLKCNQQLHEEKLGTVRELLESRVIRIEKRIEEVKRESKEREARIDVTIAGFQKAIDIFEETREDYKQAIIRTNSLDNKIEKLSWTVESLKEKIEENHDNK